MFMWIFPVKVHTNAKETVFYAFFHSGSGGALCTQRQVNELDVKGYDDKIVLSTINGSLKARSSKFVELQIVSLVSLRRPLTCRRYILLISFFLIQVM